MKYLSEYRNPALVEQYLNQLKKTVTRPWTIMEVCGADRRTAWSKMAC
jgi:hydrogenase expression/formation protein HypD